MCALSAGMSGCAYPPWHSWLTALPLSRSLAPSGEVWAGRTCPVEWSGLWLCEAAKLSSASIAPHDVCIILPNSCLLPP